MKISITFLALCLALCVFLVEAGKLPLPPDDCDDNGNSDGKDNSKSESKENSQSESKENDDCDDGNSSSELNGKLKRSAGSKGGGGKGGLLKARVNNLLKLKLL